MSHPNGPRTGRPPTYAPRGMVATPHSLASSAGLDALQRGGHATISEDLETKKKLFNALAKAWFPGGAEDPDLELVEVRIMGAEYWDIKESKTTQLLKMATAAVTGNKPEMGEHRELHVNG